MVPHNGKECILYNDALYHEAAGHSRSIVRKERELSTGSQFAHSFFFFF